MGVPQRGTPQKWTCVFRQLSSEVLEERVAEELAEDVAEKRQCNQKAHIFLLSFRLIFRLQRYTYRCTTSRYTVELFYKVGL